MPQLFISYRRDDTAGHAGRLYERLKNEFGDDNVFVDVVTLTAGVDFREAIRERVSVCDAMVVLIGRRWLSPAGDPRLFAPDDVVRFELETALEHQIRIIPVVTDRATMPAASDLPPSVQAIARKHAHELTDRRWESDAAELVEVVQRPGLPKLDQRDLDAVRGFLPGKLLGRTAAVVSLALILLGYVGAVDQVLGWLGSGFDTWLRNGLIFGIPVLAVFAQVGVEWVAKRQRRRLQDLAVEPANVPQGYFRIGPYTAEDREQFDRADQAQRRVLDWIRRGPSVPLYLTGDSGSGKSSLLNAFVLPTLRDEGWTVVQARAWQDPETALRDTLIRTARNMRRTQSAAQPVRTLLEAAARRSDAGLLVVLDQFEEFVILGNAEARGRFLALVNDLCALPIKNVRLLLVLRSDYEARVEECGLPLFRQGENHLPVGRFTLAAAHRFMTRSSLGLSDVQLERLLTSAAALDQTPGLIRPITLNVVGMVLSAGQRTAQAMDAEKLIGSYIAQALAQPAIRGHASAILGALITAFGTKRPMTEEDLQELTKLRRGEVRAVLNGLASAGMVRPLDSEQAVWELSHDFIARAVASQLGRDRWSALRRVAAYAAPILLTLSVSTVAVGTAYLRTNPHQIRSDLADLGLTVTVAAGRAQLEANSLFLQERFDNATPLLLRLNAATPIDSMALPRTSITNLEPIRGLTDLRTLDLMSTKVADLEPLRNLRSLTELRLHGTAVSSLEPLQGLTALSFLDVSDTRIDSVGPLRNLTALDSLQVSLTSVASLEPLQRLTALTSLALMYTKVVDLEPLRNLKGLKELRLSYTPISNLEPLEELTGLISLDASHTRVVNIEPLQTHRGLTELRLSATSVSNVEPLTNLTALTILDLSGTKITDLKPLRQLKALKSVYLSSTPVSGSAILSESESFDLIHKR